MPSSASDHFAELVKLVSQLAPEMSIPWLVENASQNRKISGEFTRESQTEQSLNVAEDGNRKEEGEKEGQRVGEGEGKREGGGEREEQRNGKREGKAEREGEREEQRNGDREGKGEREGEGEEGDKAKGKQLVVEAEGDSNRTGRSVLGEGEGGLLRVKGKTRSQGQKKWWRKKKGRSREEKLDRDKGSKSKACYLPARIKKTIIQQKKKKQSR